MLLKMTVAMITEIIGLILSIVMFFAIGLAMNGFSSSDASYGFLAFAFLALVVTVLVAVGAGYFAGKLVDRKFNRVLAAMVSVGLSSIVGAALTFISGIAGLIVAEIVRVNF